MSLITTVEFDHFDVVVRWHREGRFYPASGTSPATCPVPRVESCVIHMGDNHFIAGFAALPEDMQGCILDELLAEISSEYSDQELSFETADWP